MDAIDRKILTALQDDLSVSISDLAKRVGLSQTPAWKRVQKLEQTGVILKRVAIVAPERIGLGLTAFVQIEAPDHSAQWLENFSKTVAAMPEVMEFYRMAGDVDYILRVVVSDMGAYDVFSRNLIAEVPIKKVISRFAMEKLKSTTAYKVPELPPN